MEIIVKNIFGILSFLGMTIISLIVFIYKKDWKDSRDLKKKLEEESEKREQRDEKLLEQMKDLMKEYKDTMQDSLIRHEENIKELFKKLNAACQNIIKLEGRYEKQDEICKLNHKWNGKERRENN